MKKSMFLGLVLISAAVSSVLLAIGRVNGGKENIVITQEVLSGDPEAAAGVALRIPSQWSGRLLWDTEYLVGGEGRAESVFSFLQRKARWEEAREITLGLSFEMGLFDMGGAGSWGTDYGLWMLVPDAATMEELFRRVREEGEGGALTVNIRDYYSYYPVFAYLQGDSVAYEGDYRETVDYLGEFFHISVGEDDRWEIGAGIGDGGEIHEERWNILGGERLSLAGTSASGKGGFYFSYDVRDAESGGSVERRQNRGIFFFPYAEGRMDLRQVRKLCGLPEGVCPLRMLADEEEGLLYLAVREPAGYSLLVYETEEEGLKPVQAVALDPGGSGPQAENGQEVYLSFCGGGILVTWSDNSFCFVVRGEEEYGLWCQGRFPDPMEGTAYRKAPFPEEHVSAFDGERLVLAAYETGGSLNVVLAVYGREGQRYGGLYRHSSEGDWDGGFGSPDGISPQGSRGQMLGLAIRN